jgi:hypothetical protein
MTSGARPSAIAGGGRAVGPVLGRKPSWTEKWREEKRLTKKKSRGTAGLREMGCATKQEKDKRRVFCFWNERFKHKFEYNQPKINAPACMQQ